MAQSHNCLTRGLNAIIQQAPHISEASQPGYNAQDVKDLLFYVESWTMTVDHHHMTEETTMFPAIEKLAGVPGLMSGPLHQHEVFHRGLVELQNYAKEFGDRPDEYQWSALKSAIETFAPALMQHLTEEIGVISSLEKTCDSEGLKKAWAEAEAVAKANGNLGMLVSTHTYVSSTYYLRVYFTNLVRQYDVFPLVLGTCDKSYDGGNDFPPLPGAIPYAIKYWFGRRHAGAWRFNPCDYWGNPVPLPMLPENRAR